jgi:acyl-CoA synthetase (AMP-forming)/AMP-acid ligase II
MSPTWSELVTAAVAADRAAVVSAIDCWSGTDLLQIAAGLRDWLSGLDAAGIVPALLSDTGPAMALVLGGAEARHPIAPLGPRLTVPELAACVRGLDANVLITEPAFVELAQEVAWSSGARLAVLPDPLPRADPGEPPADPAATAWVLHTSGTTGIPKPVLYRQGAMAARTRIYTECVPLGPGDVFVAAPGFHHIAGSGNLAVALAAGATIAGFPSFSVDAWRALTPYGVTHTLLVPSMIEMLLTADALALPTLRSVQYGAAPIHPDTLSTMLETLPGVALWQFFGQTEGSPICALSHDDHRAAAGGRPELLHSIGRAAPEVEIVLETVDADGVGEICARGPHLFRPDEDGWLRTGDIGRVDADGYVYLVGRRGDTINRGGENVRPLEVETILRSHPAVLDVAVIGVPDRRLGEEVAAYVVPSDPAAPPDPQDLTAFARSSLAGFKVPRRWTFVADLPRNSQGKLLRRVLHAQAEGGG